MIKSLSTLPADVATFSGATILGDGTAALIIDVGRLVSGGRAEGVREYQVTMSSSVVMDLESQTSSLVSEHVVLPGYASPRFLP